MTCWAHGVPVMYWRNLGTASENGWHGGSTNGRPVIILSKASQLWAWQLFILAHEVGHVALGHES